MRIRLLTLAALAAGCTLQRGDAFGTLEPSLSFGIPAGEGRLTADGWLKLDTDYQLHLSSASASLAPASIQLVSASEGGAATGSFDPANPPAGYSLCHGGHCHRDDGALVPYGEIGAGAAGGETVVATLPAPPRVDLLSTETLPLGCEPSCDLPRTTLSSARGSVNGLVVEGRVRDGRVPARFEGERSFRFEVPQGDLVVETPLELSFDRSAPPDVRLFFGLQLSPELFDGLDWQTDPLAPAKPGYALVLSRVQQTLLRVRADRHEGGAR